MDESIDIEELTKEDEILQDYSKLEEIDGRKQIVLKSICKIEFNENDGGQNKEMGTGFLIKFKNEKNKKYSYFLFTCEHVIKKNKHINISFEFGFNSKELNLNNNKRFIKDFLYMKDLDVIAIQILKEDNIHESYFLNYNHNNAFEEYEQKNIFIPQYLKGQFKTSEGKIEQVYKNKYFFYIQLQLIMALQVAQFLYKMK